MMIVEFEFLKCRRISPPSKINNRRSTIINLEKEMEPRIVAIVARASCPPRFPSQWINSKNSPNGVVGGCIPRA